MKEKTARQKCVWMWETFSSCSQNNISEVYQPPGEGCFVCPSHGDMFTCLIFR